jgi:hypothetical protein
MASFPRAGAGQSLPYNSGAGSLGLERNEIKFFAGGDSILRVAEDGFYVRGVKVKQDDNEAKVVYNAFKRWLVEYELRKEYK